MRTRLPELEAEVIDGCPQARRGDSIPPQVADALVLRGQRLIAAAGNPAQRRGVPLARLVDQSLSLGWQGVGREVERFVDDTEVALVVKEARVGVDLGVDAYPELHVAFELRRTRHQIFGALGVCGHQRRKQHQAEPGTHMARTGEPAQVVPPPCRVHLHL